MRDFKVIMPNDPEIPWSLDLDIIDGVPAFVEFDRNTQDQRAALSAFMSKGTVPGKPDVGIDWGALLEQDATVLTIDNQIKQSIAEHAAIPSIPTAAYMPAYETSADGIHVHIIQSQ